MKPLPIVGVLAASLLCSAAYAAGAHVHGAATLRVAVDGNELMLEFESPLDNLVGFEHAPRTENEKAAVRRMAEQLRQAERLFVPSAAAKCSGSSVKLQSSAIDPVLLEAGGRAPASTARKPAKPAPPQPKGAEKGKDSHASLIAEVVFRCAQPERLSALEVNAFEAFAGLKRVDVDVAGAKKQVSARLTARARRITW